jgi:hypothetical protein
MNLALYITLQKPPVNIFFGLQKGTGNNCEIVQSQQYTSTDLHFNFTVEIKGDHQKDPLPDFKGPFVQGPKTGRFIYIVIRGIAGSPAELCNGRMKIPLTGISWDVVHKAEAITNPALETRVPGTGKNGGPNYATVKPFDGWVVKIS